jgi:hypothetical protein
LIVPLDLRRAAPPPAAAYVVDATLAVYPTGSEAGSRTPIATFVGRTDETGTFAVRVAGGLDGRYDFVAKPAGAISRELNAVNVDRGVAETLSFGTFAEGDASGDDTVDGTDLALALAAVGRAAGEPGYDPRVDFDRDGAVTLLDFSLLARGYSLTGPVQVP